MARRVQITKHVCSHCNKPNESLSSCAGCQLVQYCDKQCQTTHWSKHKRDCKAKVSKYDWAPKFELEKRSPGWAGGKPPPAMDDGPSPSMTLPGLNRKMPAIDVLCLDKNEGADWAQPLNILFAGICSSVSDMTPRADHATESGDIASVIKTVVALPETFSAPLRICINDEEHVSMRNYLLIQMAISSKDPRTTAELAVNLWYNEFWPPACASVLRSFVESEILGLGDAFDLAEISIEGLTDPAVFIPFFDNRKVFERKHGGNTLRLHMKRGKSMNFSFLHQDHAFSKYGSDLESLQVKPWQGQGSQRDNWDTILMRLPPHWRQPFGKYFYERIVWPFGAPRRGTWSRNNTIGVMGGCYDNPLESWDLKEVLAVEAGGPRNDLYGKLFFYVRGLFEKFIIRLQSLKVDFEVHCCQPAEMPKQMAGVKFERIMIANLGQTQSLGLQTMLKDFSPLLKSHAKNPHATLVDEHRSINTHLNLFKHCKMCNPRYRDLYNALGKNLAAASAVHEVENLMRPRLFIRPQSSTPNDVSGTAWGVNRILAHLIVHSFDEHWELYQRVHRFDEIAAAIGMRQKANTVVDPKPLALKLVEQNKGKDRATPESQAEFDALFAFNPLSDCRYVEWQRSATGAAPVSTSTGAERHGPTCYEE
ncbi:hypothetical protein E8E14_002909 [Neopestalotiopsis sp. 37M]|nr:hypothetical protein E8E14_002909 [Neopestalotiopsis sp. 37M]